MCIDPGVQYSYHFSLNVRRIKKNQNQNVSLKQSKLQNLYHMQEQKITEGQPISGKKKNKYA